MAKRQTKRDRYDLVDEAWEQVENLRGLCALFQQGHYAQYKPMSVILRTLLIGSSGYGPLAKEVVRDLSFFPLKIRPTKCAVRQFVIPAELVIVNDQGGAMHYMAGNTMNYLGVDDGGVVCSRHIPTSGDVVRRTSVKSMFNLVASRQALDLWIQSPFLRPEWSIASFIRCIANKDGGAHVDCNQQLTAMEEFGNVHRHLCERLSDYVVHEISAQLKQTYPFHKCRER